MTKTTKRLLATGSIVLALAVTSQFMLVGGARNAAIDYWDSVKGAGLAAGCGPAETRIRWASINTFVVEVWEDCHSPKAGEGLNVRLHWGFGGWKVEEEFDHWVV